MSGLRQSPEPRKITPPRIESIHRLGQIGHLWGCTLCLSVYPSAQTSLDAQLIHGMHCAEIKALRDDPHRPSNLAEESGGDPMQRYPQGQGIW